MWIAEGTLSSVPSGGQSALVMLSGQVKLTKIGNIQHIVAAAMSGYAITGDLIQSQDISEETLSMTLNSKMTTAMAAQVLIDNGNVDSAIM